MLSSTNKIMRKYLDIAGISLSGVCFIHCLLTPIMIMISPIISFGFFSSHEFHETIIYFVIPFAVIALAIGCKKHHDLIVAILGIVGIFILFTALWVHEHESNFPEVYSILITMTGSLIIIGAHYRNRLLCQKEEYKCHKQD